eukprot:COSAG06_NODE_218_length_20036_cov_21.649446_8_plen_118_part_00
MCNTPAIVGTGFNPQYVLDDVELVLQKIVMPPAYVSTMMKSMKESGMIRYDFNAMQTYKYSMLSQDREGTIMLPLQNSRAKAMLCCPINATVPKLWHIFVSHIRSIVVKQGNLSMMV